MIPKSTRKERRSKASSGQANRQRVAEHVARIPTRFYLLQSRIILAVVERVPRHAGVIQRRIEQINVGMIYERSIVAIVWNGNATSLGEEIAIERAHPTKVVGFFVRIEPAGSASHVENRAA